MILPQWTEKYSKSEGGRDHLAYEYVGVLMLERLLPGISNITMRARYYSFFPWVLYRFFNTPEACKKTYKNFRRHLKIKSLAFLYANSLLHAQEYNTGIDGIDLARRELRRGEKKTYLWPEEDVKEYKDNYWIYSQKLRQLGITAENEEYNIESLTLTRGKKLAEAFEESIKSTDYFKKYCDKGDLEIPAEVLREYGRIAGILELQRSRKEQNLLLEALFRFTDIPRETEDVYRYYIADSSSGSERARRESLLLYLDIIDQHRGVLKYDDIRNIQYFAKVQPSLYKPSKTLIHTLEFWRMFQLRQYFVYAIESIFRGVTLAIENNAVAFDDLTERIIGGINFKVIKKDFGLSITENTNLKNLIKKIQKGKRDEGFDKSVTLDSTLNEEVLYRAIENHLHTLDHTFFIGYALLFIILLYSRFNYYRKNNLPYWKFGEIGGETHLSLDVFFNRLEQMVKENTTLEGFVSTIVNDYIIRQHIFVAMAKLSWYRNDTFHFSYDEGVLKGIHIADINMNAPKFRNVLNILTDLGLISGEEDKYRLTKRGKEILQNYGR